MKKLIVIIVALAINLAVGAHAQTLRVETLKGGGVRLAQTLEKTEDVAFDSGVLDYGDKWKDALSRQGVVAIKSHPTITRNGLFHVTRTRIADVGILAKRNDTVLMRISVVHGATSGSYEYFCPYLVFLFLSGVFFVLEIWKNRRWTLAVSGIFAVASSLLITLHSAGTGFGMPLAASTLPMVSALVFVFCYEKKSPQTMLKVLSICITCCGLSFMLL